MASTAQVAALATAYAHGPEAAPEPSELAAFHCWLTEQFIPIQHLVWFTNQEVSPEALLKGWKEHGRIVVSLAHNEHPFFSYTVNARLRAVHDWHHIQLQADMSFWGEYETYTYACDTAPRSIYWMLFSEIVLQAAAALHYGHFLKQKMVRV